MTRQYASRKTHKKQGIGFSLVTNYMTLGSFLGGIYPPKFTTKLQDNPKLLDTKISIP